MATLQVRGLDRITLNPEMLQGQPCIRGMRIPASLLVNLVAHGMTTAEIIEDYPEVEPDDIKQALLYASQLMREHGYPAEVEAVG